MTLFKLKLKKGGFTLMEVILVIVLISIFAVIGVRMMGTDTTAKKFQETIERIDTIQRLFYGDERIVVCGRRADWGYWGYNSGGSVPASLSNLAILFPHPNPNYLTTDAWGTNLSFTSSGSGSTLTYTINSAGASRTAPFNQDISIAMKGNQYVANDVYLVFKDINGTLLLPIWSTTGNYRNRRIRRVDAESAGAVSHDFLSDGAEVNMQYDNGLLKATNVRAGLFYVEVFAGNGVAGNNSDVDWTPYLFPGFSSFHFVDIVYPKLNSNEPNIIEIRFPGSVSSGPEIVRGYVSELLS